MKRCLVVGAMLAVALLPALVDAPTAEARTPRQAQIQHENNLKQIGLAMHAYHDAFKRFPPAATVDKAGKPLLSWRVAILPFLEQEKLYNQFKQDEPWDSAHNIKLLETIPAVYAPLDDGKGGRTKTAYCVFAGPGTVFDGNKGISFVAITDGTSNTILVVEAGEGVPWTKPQDLPYSDKEALPKLGQGKNGFAVLMCDGSVKQFRSDFDVQQMRYAILRADGNVVDFGKLER